MIIWILKYITRHIFTLEKIILHKLYIFTLFHVIHKHMNLKQNKNAIDENTLITNDTCELSNYVYNVFTFF